ncbi:MAG: hypothetical protein JWP36_2039, partial [Paucimonas sp.]|nr:hypothetical protein [Paucimonas sp.]
MNTSLGAGLAPGLSFLRPALLLALALLVLAPNASAASRDMQLTGSHGLQGRSAYQPVIQQQAGKWIAYVGHHAGHAINPLTGRDEQSGTSILDVTDPARPQLLHHLPGSGGGAQMARVCKGDHFGAAHVGRTYLLRTLGDEAHETWDVSDPARPRRLARIGPVAGTHKNFWECDTGIAYLVSGAAGWRTGRMTQIYDLSDPARPVFIRNFGLVGQEPGAGGPVP